MQHLTDQAGDLFVALRRRSTGDGGHRVLGQLTGCEQRHRRRQLVAPASDLDEPLGSSVRHPALPGDPMLDRPNSAGRSPCVVLRDVGDHVDQPGDRQVDRAHELGDPGLGPIVHFDQRHRTHCAQGV